MNNKKIVTVNSQKFIFEIDDNVKISDSKFQEFADAIVKFAKCNDIKLDASLCGVFEGILTCSVNLIGGNDGIHVKLPDIYNRFS